VIATDYSGSADLLDARNGWPVPYELVEVGPGNEPYDAGASWAAPDLDAAATAMRAVRDDPIAAAQLGAAGAELIAREHSPQAVGAAMRARLEALRPAIERRVQAGAPARGRPLVRRLRELGGRTRPADADALAAHGAMTAALLAEQRRLAAELADLRARLDG
jgi:hypothetical protein